MFLTVLLLAALLAGCSRQKIVGREDLRSDLTAAISLAAETETFADYVAQGRATQSFAEGHLAYLAESARQSAKELRESTPTPSIAGQFHALQKQLDRLAYQILDLRYELLRGPTTAASTRELTQLRLALEQAKAAL